MKNDIYTPVVLGLMTVLALVFSLVFISLVQLQSINESMERLVEVTNIKTAAANDMRDAIRLRSDSLKTMQLTSDIFDRDEEHLRFMNHAGKYRVAREKLASLGMDINEREIIEELQRLVKISQPYNDKAASLLMSEAPVAVTRNAIKIATEYQQKLLVVLESLVAFEKTNTEEALKATQKRYSGTRQLMLALTGIALLFSLLVARTVIRRASKKSRELAYHASHDALTGLINRHEFECRVVRAIEHTIYGS